jgi:hypothetical protein
LGEPLSEGDVIQISYHVHTSIKIKEGADDGARTKANCVVELIAPAELFGAGESD